MSYVNIGFFEMMYCLIIPRKYLFKKKERVLVVYPENCYHDISIYEKLKIKNPIFHKKPDHRNNKLEGIITSRYKLTYSSMPIYSVLLNDGFEYIYLERDLRKK